MDLTSITDNGRSGRGILFVISSVSGGGKTTVIKHLLDEIPNLRLSVSHTTREPRKGERDGVDYHFVSEEKFEDMVKKGQFLEWARVYGYRYGTSLGEMKNLVSQKKDLVLDIDVQGGLQVREKRPDAVLVFLLLPGEAEQKKRLEERGTEAPKHLRKRLEAARRELATVSEYDYAVLNDELGTSVATVKSIILSERCRVSRSAGSDH